MAKNKFLTTNYGYKNSSNRYAFKIDVVSGSNNTTIDNIVIKTGDKTQEFLDTINSYIPNITTGQAATFYNCSIRTTNSLYSEPRLLEIIQEAEDKLKIIFWTVTEKDGQYTFSKSALQHPSASMVKTNEADNLNSGKIHNVFFLDEFPLLGNVEIGCYSVNIGYENIGGQVSTFSNGQSNMPLGDFSSAFGWKNKTGYACSAFGFENKILGQESSGFGAKITIANGAQRSAGFGANHTINVNYGMAFGYSHQITGGGTYGTAFGLANSVKGKCGFAAGNGCISNSENSFSFGEGLRTYGKNVAVFGQYNAYASNGAKTYLFAIGNGTSGTQRKNALELDLESNLKIEGDLITRDGKLSDIVKNASNKQDIELLEKYGTTDVYVLQEGVDIIVENNVVTQLLKNDYSMYGAVAFPEGITGINLVNPNNAYCGQPFIANKVIMPLSLKTITRFSFANYVIFSDRQGFDANSETIKTQGDYTWEDASVTVRVKEFVLNEGLETVARSEFQENIYLEKINIPSNWTEIKTGVLGVCFNLKGLVIPATVKSINWEWGALSDYSDTIYGYGGTAAETYAKENNIPFVNMGSNHDIPIILAFEEEEEDIVILPNKYYVFSDRPPNIIIEETDDMSTILSEFMFSFATPNTVDNSYLKITSDLPIIWIKEPNLKPNYYYEVSIVNTIGVIIGREVIE